MIDKVTGWGREEDEKIKNVVIGILIGYLTGMIVLLVILVPTFKSFENEKIEAMEASYMQGQIDYANDKILFVEVPNDFLWTGSPLKRDYNKTSYKLWSDYPLHNTIVGMTAEVEEN